jgi:hypothetical protein
VLASAADDAVGVCECMAEPDGDVVAGVETGVGVRFRSSDSMSCICCSRRISRTVVLSLSVREDGECGVEGRLIDGERCMCCCMRGEMGSFLLPRVSCDWIALLSMRTLSGDICMPCGDDGDRVAGRGEVPVCVSTVLAQSALMYDRMEL